MKKELIYGILIGLVLFIIFGFKDTNGKYIDAYSSNENYNIPLKQKDVIVTENIKQMKNLLKKGYVCEDVDFHGQWNYYTLVKY